MRPKQPFNYNRVLNRLIQLRYQARQANEDSTPEIMELERQIYAYLRDEDDGDRGDAEGLQ